MSTDTALSAPSAAAPALRPSAAVWAARRRPPPPGIRCRAHRDNDRDHVARRKMNRTLTGAFAFLAIALAACGGAGHLSVDHRQGENTLSLNFPPGRAVEHPLRFRISGGIPPYESSIEGCPDWVTLFPDQRILAGTAPAALSGQTFFCTYHVIESDPGFRPARTVTRGLRLVVGSGVARALQFTRPREPDLSSLRVGTFHDAEFSAASGGVEPYTYELECALPRGLGFNPDTRILSGTPLEAYRGPDCTYRVTDSATPPESASRSVRFVVDPLDRGDWRFRTRTVEPGGPCAERIEGDITPVAILPLAHQARDAEPGRDRYRLTDVASERAPDRNDFLTFHPDTRRLRYTHRSADPVLGTPTTYRYLVGTDTTLDAENAHDALCVDVQYNTGRSAMCGDPNADPPDDPQKYVHISLRIRDDAYLDGTEWRCPDTTAPTPRSAAQDVSNPVHEALGPVHARRALDVAHGSLRDGVRAWTPGAPRMLSAIAPKVGIGSLSGQSDGFDYTGSSESLSTGAEIGSGSWQAGVVGSFTRTELHYRAAASLAGRGYRSGEHTTEIFSLHPFAAWHPAAGGHFWTSLGAGVGELRHRDELGFPSWSRSDVRLRAYAAGASVPVADFLAGELEAEAGIEAFAFEIEGGGRISSALPTLRGRDWRTGLAWSAPVAGAPSLSMAYRHLTGDGPEGGQLEAKASVSAGGVFDPRLALTGNAEGSLGIGENDYSSWALSGGIRFASGRSRRGFGLELDTRLDSLDSGGPAGVGARGEAGYGVWTGSPFGTVRPYFGLVRHAAGNSPERTIGADVRHAPHSHARLEFQDRHRSRALRFSLRHRF